MAVQIDRGFVRIREGQVHYRAVGDPQAGERPLVLLHSSPVSAATLQPLMRALAERHRQPLYAPDTLGNGDSCAAQAALPDMAYYAGAVARQLDTLGIGAIDLYGAQTGGSIATEFAIRYPQRVRRLAIDGMAFYPAALQADMLQHYTPEIPLDPFGGQFHWAWRFVRDGNLFFPWYKRDLAHQMKGGMPSPDYLHDYAVELLKGITTYHHAYRASFRYPKLERLALVTRPTLLLYQEDQPSYQYKDQALAAAPQGRAGLLPAGATAANRAALLSDWLDGKP